MLRTFDKDHQRLYYDQVLDGQTAEGKADLRAMLSPELLASPFVQAHIEVGEMLGLAKGQALGRAEGEALGRAEGEARALLKVLDRQKVEVPATARERILACTDLEQLDSWLDRAITAVTIDDVLGE